MTDYKENLKTAIQDHLLRGKGAKTISIDVVNPSDEKVASEKAVVTLINVFKDYVKSGTDPLLTDILGTGELLESKLKSKGVDCDFGQHSSGKDCLYALAGKIEDIPDWENCGYLYWNSGTSASLVTSENSLVCTSDALVDYGDGTVEKLDGKFSHTYTSSGTFKVRFKGVTGFNDGSLFKNKTALCQEVYIPEVTNIDLSENIEVFVGTNIIKANLPKLTLIKGNGVFMFISCPNLITLNLPKLTTIESDTIIYFIASSHLLEKISLPSLTTIKGEQLWTFNDAHGIKHIDLPVLSNLEGTTIATIFQAGTGQPLEYVNVGNLSNIETDFCCLFASGSSEYYENPKVIKFNSSTPPIVNSSKSFGGFNGTIIIVPNGSKTAYETAPNYPNPSTNTYVEVHA